MLTLNNLAYFQVMSNFHFSIFFVTAVKVTCNFSRGLILFAQIFVLLYGTQLQFLTPIYLVANCLAEDMKVNVANRGNYLCLIELIHCIDVITSYWSADNSVSWLDYV